jgi:hypothetical protein
MGHAGAVDLGVDVADEVGFEIEVLNLGQRVVGIALGRMPVKYFDGVVATEG